MSWSTLLLVPVSVLYFLVVLVLYVFGLNFLYLSIGSRRRENRVPADSVKALEPLPFVTVQLPIYNEWYVARRLIEAAATLDYPPELLEVQVLDDSTDETRELAAETVERLRHSGSSNVVLLHRSERRGYKAGALAEGLAQARGEFIAIFDADFVPPADIVAEVKVQTAAFDASTSFKGSTQAQRRPVHFGALNLAYFE